MSSFRTGMEAGALLVTVIYPVLRVVAVRLVLFIATAAGSTVVKDYVEVHFLNRYGPKR